MPEAFKCSKCGDLFEGQPHWRTEMEQFVTDVELCERCYEEFVAWFEGHEATNLDSFSQEELE